MKNLICSTAAVFALMIGTQSALAQAVVITPEQEVVVQKYVSANKVTSVDVPNVQIAVGTALPETVEMHTIDGSNISYRYVVVNGKRALVDPGTRKIVRVMN